MAYNYHAFWITRFGYKSMYKEVSHDEALALVKESQSEEDGSNVTYLRIVFGQLMEWEPAKIIESYRFKIKGKDL
jgi:hypothetical protein